MSNRAERRQTKKASWKQYTVEGDPSTWPKGKVPLPRRERRAAWRNGHKPELFVRPRELADPSRMPSDQLRALERGNFGR